MVGNKVVKSNRMFHSKTPKYKNIRAILAPMQGNMNHVLDDLHWPLNKGIFMMTTNSRKWLSLELVLAILNKELSIEYSIVTVKLANLGSSQFPEQLLKAFLSRQCFSSSKLSWKWRRNDSVMMQQNGFVAKFSKKVWRWMTFLILLYLSHVTEVCCTNTTRDCWSYLFYFLFLQ